MTLEMIQKEAPEINRENEEYSLCIAKHDR